jgi:hypothetical protein
MEQHNTRGCSGMVGRLECKCYRFSAHKIAPDLFHDRREELDELSEMRQ